MKRRQRGRGRSTAEALAAAALLHDHYPIHYTECLLTLRSGPLLSGDCFNNSPYPVVSQSDFGVIMFCCSR